jgi:simple sugar transport system substrate-binding protein
VIEEENVAESIDVEKSIESMINLDGAKLLFPTSYGYWTHILKMARKYPDIHFFHAGGPWQADKDPANAYSYFGSLHQAHFLAGIVAGYTTKTNKLGFVAAKPFGLVLRNINSWTIGARMANPDATVRLIFTGDWSMPVKEAEATNSLIDQGADVISCHVDSPKVLVETCKRRGVYVTGHNADQSPLAPELYLTGAQYDWITPVNNYIDLYQAGKPMPNFVRGGFESGYAKIHDYGPAVSAAARKHADEMKAKLVANEHVIFVGPMKDNKGNEVIPAGTKYGQFDLWQEKMNFLVEGVIGSV